MIRSFQKLPKVEVEGFLKSEWSQQEMQSRVVKLILVVAALCFALPAGAFAAGKDIPAGNVRVSTPLYSPNLSGFNPELGTYTYTVRWQGIPAATVEVSVEREGADYRVVSKAKTARAIDIFYKLRYRAEGKFSAVNFLPQRTIIDQKENSREKFTDISFNNDGTIRALRFRKGRKTEIEEFDPHNYTLDPFSAGFLARSLDWQVGQTREFDTFTGKTRYLISLTAEDKIKMDVNGQQRDVWVISPKVKRLNRPGAKKKLKRANIYVTADDKREVLQIVSKVFVGSVKTRLESFVPSSRPNPGVQMASRKVSFTFK